MLLSILLSLAVHAADGDLPAVEVANAAPSKGLSGKLVMASEPAPETASSSPLFAHAAYQSSASEDLALADAQAEVADEVRHVKRMAWAEEPVWFSGTIGQEYDKPTMLHALLDWPADLAKASNLTLAEADRAVAADSDQAPETWVLNRLVRSNYQVELHAGSEVPKRVFYWTKEVFRGRGTSTHTTFHVVTYGRDGLMQSYANFGTETGYFRRERETAQVVTFTWRDGKVDSWQSTDVELVKGCDDGSCDNAYRRTFVGS